MIHYEINHMFYNTHFVRYHVGPNGSKEIGALLTAVREDDERGCGEITHFSSLTIVDEEAITHRYDVTSLEDAVTELSKVVQRLIGSDEPVIPLN